MKASSIFITGLGLLLLGTTVFNGLALARLEKLQSQIEQGRQFLANYSGEREAQAELAAAPLRAKTLLIHAKAQAEAEVIEAQADAKANALIEASVKDKKLLGAVDFTIPHPHRGSWSAVTHIGGSSWPVTSTTAVVNCTCGVEQESN